MHALKGLTYRARVTPINSVRRSRRLRATRAAAPVLAVHTFVRCHMEANTPSLKVDYRFQLFVRCLQEGDACR